MKKILIATTALVATASVAAAEISLSGLGRFGLGYDEGNDDEFRIEQRFRLTVTGTAETDGGVKFEGRIRAQTDESSDSSVVGPGDTINGAGDTNGNQLEGFGAAGFAVTFEGFRLDVGNVSDVLDSGDAVNFFGDGVGLTSFAEYNQSFDGFGAVGGFGNGNIDATTIKLRYTAGDFTVAASYSSDKTGADDLEEYQIGVGYSFGDYNVGAAYGEVDTSATDFGRLLGGIVRRFDR